MLAELRHRLWSHPEFHHETSELLGHHLRQSVLGTRSDGTPVAALKRLARSAAILATSSDPLQRSTAYKIATALALGPGDQWFGLKYISLIVLSRLGNFPGSDLAKEKLSIDEFQLPLRLAVEADLRRESNTVQVGHDKFALTDFQLELWRTLERPGDVSVAAPTSAGKSFAIQLFIRRMVLEGRIQNCAFLVPSRALISQVAEQAASWARNTDPQFEIVTVPLAAESDLPGRALYIMTQERLQLTLQNHLGLSFDLIVVDESQSLGDGPRGLLLTNVIDECRRRKNSAKLLFAGAHIANPRALGAAFGIDLKEVSTRDPTVAQNIIFVDTDKESPTKLHLSYLTETGPINLGSMSAPYPVYTDRARLIAVPTIVGLHGQSLVYVLGPAECENVAFGIADAVGGVSTDLLTELSSFVAEAVHPKYQLVTTVKKGVGFHYGRIPSLVRRSIEDAFTQGHLKFLVTTSTLLQGVNMPARNLFMFRPHKGDEPISSIDFWNLAGRAGRLGKEFEGNVYLIDYNMWENNPLEGEKEVAVTSTLETHVFNQTDGLATYIRDQNAAPRREQTDEFENTFVRLYSEFRRGTLLDRLGQLGLRQHDVRTKQIVEALEYAASRVTIPVELVDACPTVSPYRQMALLKRLRSSFAKNGPDYVIPKHPLQSGAYPSLSAVLKRCQDTVLMYPPKDKTYRYIALIGLRWMKGEPLPRIIDDALDYKRKKGQKANIATTIRQVLTDVEQKLRFECVRLTSCYNSVLRFLLLEANRSDLLGSIPAIPLFLEVGACTRTMMAFMELGISRFTAERLSKLPARPDMTPQSAQDWLSRQDVEALDLPRASADEIRRLKLG